MGVCHFKFKDKDGTEITIIGKPAMQAYLADGGLEHLFPGKVFPWMTANDNEVTEKSNNGELGFDLADAFAKRLLDGESFKSILLSRKALTNTVIKSGSIEAKRADELIELAGVIAAREIVEKGLSESETFEELASLAERMPSLNVRTSTSIMDQAYSTPLPIAYIASVRAGITKNTTVTEPTAGNGALLIVASPDKVVANELNKDRFDALKHQGFEVYNKDAVTFNFGSDSDVVIANPPFGVVKDDNGTATTFKINNQYSTNEIDHAIALNALKSMKKDGRAVLIVGAPAKILSDDARSNAYNGKAKRSFYHTLYNQYNVTDHFTVSGDLYAKQGASWPVDVIVIEGTGKSSLRLPAADLPRIINSITELKNELQSNRESLQESESSIEQGIKTESIADDEGSRASADRKLRDGSNKDDISTGVLPRPGRKFKADGQRQLANADGQYNSSSTRTIRTDNGYDKIENKFQADYTPASKVNSVGTLVPTNMQSSIGEALNRLENKYESIDGFVADQLGYDKKDIGKYFSAEQVDAIALALDNINDGKGFIIGDQTGIGKGRVNAAMIKYAIKNKIVPIFVTEKTNLYGDMIRDLNDIGMTDIKPFITNPAETIPLDEDAQKWYAESLKAKENGEPVPKKYGKFLKTPESKAHTASIIEIINSKNLSGYDVIFTTYSQMQTVSGKKPVRVDFLEAMADGGLVILDESHNAGGVSEIKGKAGKGDSESGEKGGRAAVARRLVGLAKGVFYSSATYAKRPDVLDLYSKTDMGLIADPNALKEALQAGGVPLQQAVASMLAKSGQYIRREKSFDGIAYDTVVAEVDKQFAEKASEVMRDIMRFDEVKALSIKALDDELKSDARKISGDKSTGGTGASSTNFTSVMHNMIGQMLLMLKVQPAIDEALSALKRDEKPVITLSNTMGSAIDEYVKDAGLNPGDAISLNFGDLLKRYLSKSRRVIEGDPFGKKTSRYLTDEELGPSAVKFYKSVEKKIDDYNFASYPVSPIDAIHNALHKEGYKTGEITGRGSIIDYSGNMPIYKRRPSQQTTAAGKRKTINDFNNGLIDVVILNQSGATGLSLHSSPKVGNDTRKRYMIIAQPELNIDTHMQMLGRVNRTGQLITPSYGQLVANVPAEKRPSAILAKKMAMLNAQTTAGKESAVKAKDVPDFMNEYGDEVAASVMNDNRDIHRMLGKPLTESESTGFEKDGAMRKVTGRIPVLSLKDQEMVYSLIEDAYNEYIDILTKTGQNQLEAEAMKLDAKTVSSTQVSPPLSDSNSPFAEGVNAEIVDVKKLGKPYTVDQIKELIAKVGIADANSQKDWVNNLTDNIAKEYDNRMAIIEAMPEDDDAEIKRKRGSKDNLNNQKDFVESIINKFPPGKPVRLFSPMGIEYIGYVGNFERKGDAKNYFAQGQWKLTTYVADAAKQFVIPISRLSITSLDRAKSADTDSSGKWIIESSSISDVNQALTDGHSESRENRVILTGNMLSAYAFDKTGQIINYTTDSGETKQGIMMPKKFDLAVAIDAKPIQFTNQSIAAEYLNTADRPDYGVRSRDNYFRILPQYNGSMVMYVPSSKTRGGMYFGNKRLIELTGDFVKSGSDMMVRFDKSKLEKILQITYQYSGSLEPISKENGKKFLERDNIKLSQSRPKLPGSTIAQVQDMLPAKVKKLSASGKLVIVQSVKDLPASLFNKGAAQQESLSSATAKRIAGAEALYFPSEDKIFLVADSLNKNNTMQILSHELLHRAEFTDTKLQDAIKKFESDFQKRFDLAGRGFGTPIELAAYDRIIRIKKNEFKAAIHEIDKSSSNTLINTMFNSARKGIGSKEELQIYNKVMQDALEEFRAYMVTEYVNNPQSITGKLKRIIADFIAAIRVALVRAGLDFGMVRSLSPSDLFAMSGYGANVDGVAQGGSGVMASTSPDNPDIRFSMRDSVDEINSSIREAFSPRQGKQSLDWLAGLFQRNHLIDFVAKELPMLEDYKTLSQEKDNTINKHEREIAERYAEMKDSMTHDVMNELGRVQGLATRLKFDPAKFDDGNPTQADINSLRSDKKAIYLDYMELPDGAKKTYKMMREDYKKDLLSKKSALIKRLDDFPIDRETKAGIIKQIEFYFDQPIKDGVYFPLTRDGDRVVTADKLDDDGNIIPSERIVEFVENAKQADRLMQELKEMGYKNRRSDKKSVYIKSLATTNAANNIAALAIKAIADLQTNIQQQGADATLDFSGFTANDIIKGGDFKQLIDDFNQQLIDALPDTSYRKHFIHRKGTLGYSTDTLRGYAGTRTAAAKNIASLLYDHKIYGKIQDAKDAIKNISNGEDEDTRVESLRSVLNELEKREEKLKDSSISQASQILTSLGFIGALGLNVASAAANALQVPGVTLPELSGKHGFTKAAAEINKAYKLLFNKDVLNKHSGFDLSKHPELNKPQNAPLRAALIKLNEIGKIDLTLTHEAISMGQNPSYSDNAVTRFVGGIGRYSGYLFHIAEALNRQITGIAAFNLAYRKNGGNFDEAFKDAVDVIDRTQFDYSQSNRARYMMSDTARVLTLFKSYALGISYYIGRNVHNAIKGETPEIRLAARKMVATQMAMTFATSGLFGLPIGGEALAVLGGVAGFKYKGANFAVPGAVGGMLLFQALLAGLGADDEDDVEVQFRNWLTDNFDQTTAEWIVKGPARLLPMGDISSRTGLSDIWWRPQNKELEGKDQYQAFANALLGPLGSQFAGLFTATKMYQDGEYSRAIEAMSPAAIRNIIAAARMENEGVKTIKGDPIVNRDLTMTEIANKVLGFNPTVVTNNYDANTAVAKARDRIAMKKAHLVNRYISSDPQERADLMRGDIRDFNSEVEPQERITIGSLMKSIRQRKALDRRTENGLYLSKKSEHLRDIGRFGKED